MDEPSSSVRRTVQFQDTAGAKTPGNKATDSAFRRAYRVVKRLPKDGVVQLTHDEKLKVLLGAQPTELTRFSFRARCSACTSRQPKGRAQHRDRTEWSNSSNGTVRSFVFFLFTAFM